MDIRYVRELSNYIITNRRLIKSIDFSTTLVGNLLDGICDVNKAEILNILNSINNQNIQDIDINKYRYMHRNNKLSFHKLSMAERLFLLAFAADFTHTEVYFMNEVESLTRKTLKLFIKLFGHSKYVNIACIDEDNVLYYNFFKKEVLND